MDSNSNKLQFIKFKKVVFAGDNYESILIKDKEYVYFDTERDYFEILGKYKQHYDKQYWFDYELSFLNYSVKDNQFHKIDENKLNHICICEVTEFKDYNIKSFNPNEIIGVCWYEKNKLIKSNSDIFTLVNVDVEYKTLSLRSDNKVYQVTLDGNVSPKLTFIKYNIFKFANLSITDSYDNYNDKTNYAYYNTNDDKYEILGKFLGKKENEYKFSIKTINLVEINELKIVEVTYNILFKDISSINRNDIGVFWKSNTNFCRVSKVSTLRAFNWFIDKLTIQLHCHKLYNVDLNGLEIDKINNIPMLKKIFEQKTFSVTQQLLDKTKKFETMDTNRTLHFNVVRYDFNSRTKTFDKTYITDFYLSVRDVIQFEKTKVLYIEKDKDNANFVIVEDVAPAKVAPAKVDPEKVDPEKVDPEKADPAKVDPEKVDPEKADPEKADPAKVYPAKVVLKLELFENRFMANSQDCYFEYNDLDKHWDKYPFGKGTDKTYHSTKLLRFFGKNKKNTLSSGGKCRKTKINTRIHYSKKKSKKTRRTKRTRQHREN